MGKDVGPPSPDEALSWAYRLLTFLGLNLALLAVMFATSARSKVSISLVPWQASGPISPGAVTFCAHTGAATATKAAATIPIQKLSSLGGG